MTITEILVIEHRIFAHIFMQIEHALPRLSTPAEVRVLAGLIEDLLAEHGGTEGDLAYLAYDHVMQDRGRLERLHQEHEEIDSSLRQVQSARDYPQARRLLEAALQAARQHMRFDELHVFPLLEQTLQAETLMELAATWSLRSAAALPTA